MHAPQSAQALERLSALTHAFDPFELVAFHDLVSLSGSLILGFAVTRDQAPAAEIWEISRLDEIWQAEQWGEDAEAQATASLKKSAFLNAKQMFDLCR